jgi:hypothetical protein
MFKKSLTFHTPKNFLNLIFRTNKNQISGPGQLFERTSFRIWTFVRKNRFYQKRLKINENGGHARQIRIMRMIVDQSNFQVVCFGLGFAIAFATLPNCISIPLSLILPNILVVRNDQNRVLSMC